MVCDVSQSVYFNPRSYKRSDVCKKNGSTLKYNFNPRSYKRSDVKEATDMARALISIHAPTRGATIGIPVKAIDYVISIHAPTRGATKT